VADMEKEVGRTTALALRTLKAMTEACFQNHESAFTGFCEQYRSARRQTPPPARKKWICTYCRVCRLPAGLAGHSTSPGDLKNRKQVIRGQAERKLCTK
jgi:hypothetical protein